MMVPSLLPAVTIAPSGAVVGEWSADWAAVRALAKDLGTFYIINFSKTAGCAYCSAAENGIWSKPEFTQWAKDNNIPLLYANRVSTTTEPGVSVKETYDGLSYYPTILVVDGTSATGKTLIRKFVCRYGVEVNGIKVVLNPSNFAAIIDSIVKKPVTDDVWDSTATPPGDETAATATPLAIDAVNRLHGPHTLKNSDTNDWFAITNLVAGQRYRVAVTNVTVANAVVKASFFSNLVSATQNRPWTNQPIAQLAGGFYFQAKQAGAGYVQVARGASASPNVLYTLTYRSASTTPHALTVTGGDGTDASVLEGDSRDVNANAAGAGQFFAGWLVNPANAALGPAFNAAQPLTTLVMPNYAVTLTANYQAETRVIALTGSLAFGGVMTNHVSQKTLTVANSGNRILTVTGIDCPAGFTANPTSFTVPAGGSAAVTVSFMPTAVLNYGGTLTVTSDSTGGGNTTACSGEGRDNQVPVITARTPAGDPAPINEGATQIFTVSANDNTDPEASTRGMVSVTWFVDGVQRQETRTGAPSTISSTFSFPTDANTVTGAAFRDVQVRSVALDVQGGTAETAWTLRVNNVQAAQAITFPTPAVRVLGDANFDPGATASSGLPIVYSSSNESVAQIVGGLVHITGAGSAVITASQPGNSDYRAATSIRRTLTVRVRVTAVATPPGGGTVTGAGTYSAGARVTLTARPAAGYTFLHWENGAQTVTRSQVLGGANIDATATFGLTANVSAPTLANPGAQNALVGVLFNLPLDLQSDSLPAVTTTGLPTGLRYDAATRSIIGVPIAPVENRAVTVTVKNVNPTTATQTFSVTVTALPAWATGAFNGFCNHEALGNGAVSLSVTALGRVTGKLAAAGTNYIISAASYKGLTNGVFSLEVQAKAGKAALPILLNVYLAGALPETLSVADGWFGPAAEGVPEVTLYRNVWKDAGMTSVATNYTGYYTATLPVVSDQPAAPAPGLEPAAPVLPDVAAGSGYLTLTVDRVGGVKSVGKLADGTTVSLSGVLILDEAGRVWTVLYSSPATYRGGVLFGLVEFVESAVDGKLVVRLLDAVPALWLNRSPFATGVHGDGFMRDLGVAGGWYDKLGNLYAYYADKALSVAVGSTTSVPTRTVGTNRYESVWWSPSGEALAVLTNYLGLFTGFKAPPVGTPTKVGNTWVYDAADNTVGLVLTLTRATGLFSGTFRAWFDYGVTHTASTITLQGAVTPVRENRDDGVEGRGFFLWSDRSQYVNPQSLTVPYTFRKSYDFMIESEP